VVIQRRRHLSERPERQSHRGERRALRSDRVSLPPLRDNLFGTVEPSGRTHPAEPPLDALGRKTLTQRSKPLRALLPRNRMQRRVKWFSLEYP
jgi:hypothetical protein